LTIPSWETDDATDKAGRVPICKHILACFLAASAPALFGAVAVRTVSQNEMATKAVRATYSTPHNDM
jgi:hypothetical protein